MNVQELTKTRRTIHKYKNQSFDRKVLQQALEAAIFAPNHKLTNPLKIVLVGKESRLKLFEVAKRHFMSKQNLTSLSSMQLDQLEKKNLNPAYLVIFAQVKSSKPSQSHEDFATLACAVQNFSLVLHENGIGSKWSTGKTLSDPETYKIIGLDPAQFTIEGFLWAGVPEEIPAPPPRPKLSEVVSEIP